MAFSKNLKKKIRNLRSSKFNMIPQSPTLPVRSVMPEFDLGPMVDPRAPDSVAPQPVIPESIGRGGSGGFFSNIRQLPQFKRKGTMGRKLDRMFGMSRRQTPSPMMRGGAEFGPPSLEDMLRNQAPGFLKKRIKRRMPSRRPSSRFFGGGLGSILERLPQNMERMFIDERRNFDELGMEDELPLLPRAPLPMPQDMPRERFPMMRPGFAEGEEVSMNMRIADLASSQGMAPAEQRMMLLQKTAADMGRNISDRDAQLFGMGEISFEEAMSRARPASERLERMMMGGQGRTISDMDRDRVRIDIPRAFDEMREEDIQMRNLMQQEQLGFAKGGEAFPDLTGDGQVTQADILKGRGVVGRVIS